MKKALHLLAAAAAAVLSFSMIPSCSQGTPIAEPDVSFAQYVKAYTGGLLHEDAGIRIQLASDAAGVRTGVPVAGPLFSFSPSVKGTAQWLSPSLIEFVPEAGQFKPGASYKCNFLLGKVLPVKKPFEKFEFRFMIAPKQAFLTHDRLLILPESPGLVRAEGHISLSEPVGAEEVKEMISCSEKGGEITVEPGDDALHFRYAVSGLERGGADREMEICLKPGKSGFHTRSGKDASGKEKIAIPAMEGFKVLSCNNKEGKPSVIEAVFSQPLAEIPDAGGLIGIGGMTEATFTVENNLIRIFYTPKAGERPSVNFYHSLKDHQGNALGTDFEREFEPAEEKPAVVLTEKGSILPDAAKLVLPFKAVNLRAVDMSIIRIYEDNILLFLQDNSLQGDNELRRAGRMVCRKTLRLDQDPSKDLHQWQDFSVDLSELFRQELGAIYRIRLSFKKEYSLYGKRDEAADGRTEQAMIDMLGGQLTEEDRKVWDEPYASYYEDFHDWSEYNWEDSDNPDKPSYYMSSERFPACNLMTSNIGMTAKYADTGRIWLSASDILSGKPMAGVDFDVYSFQLRRIGKGRSGADGLAEIELTGKPFAVVARKDKAKTYLRISDTDELPLSNFDVGGKRLQNGLNAYVYGERGVWRPGDTLHVTMILNDKAGIPDAHPAVLELYTPAGQFYTRQLCSSGTDGFYTYHLPTRPDDPTGTWNAYIKVGGATFHKALPIESIKPNRLKINLNIGDDILEAGKREVVTVKARWLTGPAAAGLTAKATLTLRPAGSRFKGYDGYVFCNPATNFTSSEHEILNARLDGTGSAGVQVRLPEAKQAPGLLEADLVCAVEEQGGEASYATTRCRFSPFSSYVGIKTPEEGASGCIETDKDHHIAVAVVDCEGRRVSGRRFEWRIYKLKWNWWWESRSEDLDSYVNGTGSEVVSSGKSVSGKTDVQIPFRIDYPEWGRYLIYVKDTDSGHATGKVVFVDWPSYRGRSSKTDPDHLSMLSFSTDKKSYKVGEQVEVYLPAPAMGMALVSLENGSGVLRREWVKTDAGADTRYGFTVTPEMMPNFYIHITLLQPHEHAENELPVRLYGVIPVSVENEDTHLEPEILMKDVIAPEEEFEVKIKERRKKPMTYTLAIVDEGLLDLTAFRTPDAWSALYAREALGVRTWDMYDDIAGAFSGKFGNVGGIGGGEEIRILNKKDNRFNPVVIFAGPFTLKSGTRTHKFRLPMYVGSVRVMAVAGHDRAYGKAEKDVTVRSPLMVLPTLPRVIGAGEKVSMPVNVFAMEDGVREVTVKAEAEGAVRLAGASVRTLSFAAAGDQMTSFDLIAEEEGEAVLKVTASGNGKTAGETVRLRVRDSSPKIVRTETAVLAPGETVEWEYVPFRKEGDHCARLSAYGFPSIDFDACFDFIFRYPYSCTEQLAAKGLTLLCGKDFVSEKRAAAVKETLPEVIRELYSRQLADGGFAYWPGEVNANDWASSMAGHFLSEAAKQGYEVDRNVLDRWKSFQNQLVRNYRAADGRTVNDLLQAYRLYTLALASARDGAAMNRLKEDRRLSPPAGWMLSAAYALCGKKTVAEELLAAPEEDLPEDRRRDLTFGSPERDKCIAIEALTLADRLPEALKLAQEVAEAFAGGCYSTQEAAFAAMAMHRLAEAVGNAGFDIEVAQDGRTDRMKGSGACGHLELDPTTGRVKAVNRSEGTVCLSLMTAGPAPDDGKVEGGASGLRLSVAYTDLRGQPIDPARLRQGTDFTAVLTVTNTSLAEDYTHVALMQMTPSGWEIFNERLFGGALTAAQNACDYRNIRDDRNCWFFDLDRGTKKTFKTRLRAAYEGDFLLPAITCEVMYSPEINARTASGRAVVTK